MALRGVATLVLVMCIAGAIVDAQFTTCLTAADSVGFTNSCNGALIDFVNDCIGGEMGFNFMDASGFASVTSVSYVWNAAIDCGPFLSGVATVYDIELNAVNVGTYNPGIADDGSCGCPHPPSALDVVTGTAPNTAYNLGSVNTLFSANIDPIENCQGLSLVSGCLAEVTVQGSFSGGGGDPHLWGPALGQPRFNLGDFARTRTLEDSDMDVILAESDGVVLHGHVLSKPGTDRQYFTELSLVSGEEVILVSSVVDETDACMAVRLGDHAASCLGADEAVKLDISSASAVTSCTTARQRATTNPFMQTQFSSHIDHVACAVTLETASYVVEVFYVQKGRADDGSWKESPFGFFDFHIQLAQPSASFDGLLGSTSTNRERGATSQEENHHFNEHILRHVSFV